MHWIRGRRRKERVSTPVCFKYRILTKADQLTVGSLQYCMIVWNSFASNETWAPMPNLPKTCTYTPTSTVRASLFSFILFPFLLNLPLLLPLGNRSPIADPRMRGSITGLNLDGTSLSSLTLLYHATLTTIALQTRSIVDELNGKGHRIKRLYVSGSQAQNGILMQLLADACNHADGEGALEGVVVSVSDGEDAGVVDFGGAKKEKRKGVSAVVLGAAMLGRMAHEMAEVKGKADDERKAEILWNIMVSSAISRGIDVALIYLVYIDGHDASGGLDTTGKGGAGEEDFGCEVRDLP